MTLLQSRTLKNGPLLLAPVRATAGQLVLPYSDGTVGWADAPEVNAEAWGCKFDGVTDDSTALMAALAQIPNGGTVRLKNNATLFANGATPIVLTGGQHLRGGGTGSIIKGGSGIGSGNAIVQVERGNFIDFDGGSEVWGLDRVVVDGTNVSNGTWGILVVNVGPGHRSSRGAAVTNFVVQNCHVGIRGMIDQGTMFETGLVHKCDYGVYLSDESQMTSFHNVQFRNNNLIATLLEGSNGLALGPDPLYGLLFTRCQWEANYGKAVVNDGVVRSTWNTCKWEQNGDDYITDQVVNASAGNTNSQNVYLNSIMNGCAATSPYNKQNNGGSFYAPYFYRVAAAGASSRMAFAYGSYEADTNSGFDLTNGSSNIAFLTRIACALVDPNGTLSTLADSGTHLTTWRGTDPGSSDSAAPLVSVNVAAGALSGNAYFGAQGRARFGFAGVSSFVTIDDNGTTKGFQIRLGGGQRIKIGTDWALRVMTAGAGLAVAEGANAKQGIATLVGGTVTVANSSVTANSRFFLDPQDNNTTGALRVSARTAGTSFTITSSNAGDTGVVAYQIFEPA